MADQQVLVVGLGRFGGALARELVTLGYEVLGVDGDARVVQRASDELTHVVEADSTDPEALRQLGASDFAVGIVGIGTDIEASVLTTAALVDLGVGTIWAKAVSESHARILERVGAHHVVFPERDMGTRVAHRLTGHTIDWFQLDDDFAMVETVVPREMVGRSLGEVGVRARYGVTVVAIKPAGGTFGYATAETVPHAGDVVVVSGTTENVQRFAEQT